LAIHGEITATPPGSPRDVPFILIPQQSPDQTVFLAFCPPGPPRVGRKTRRSALLARDAGAADKLLTMSDSMQVAYQKASQRDRPSVAFCDTARRAFAHEKKLVGLGCRALEIFITMNLNTAPASAAAF
jgi:hypothetical protein